MPNKSVSILGVPIFNGSLSDLLDNFSKAIESNKKLRVCVTPVNNVIWAQKDERLKKLYKTADYCTADGVPLVWASRWLGNPIASRSTGYDILPEYAKIAEENNIIPYFLGGAEGVGEDAKANLLKTYPKLNISGIYSPPYKKEFSEEDIDVMASKINESNPNVIWVCMTAPKQDFLIAALLPKINANIAIGIGASLDVVAGRFKRPPKWIQNNGLEWLYRLVNEPKRLFRRYVIEAPQFIPLIVKQIIKEKIQSKK